MERRNNHNRGKISERILKLLEKKSYGLTIEEVANSLDINRATASKYLAILNAEKKVIVREVGKAKLHYLGSSKIMGLI